jgi:putative phosphoribosyl transferase
MAFMPERWTLRDRKDAGERLAAKLGAYHESPNTVVLGLPRGGLVVAAEIARRLDLPLDVIVVRKLGAPGNPELAIGALAEGGEPWLHHESIALSGADANHLAAVSGRAGTEIARYRRLFRGGKELRLPDAATVIVADDGVATGSTVFAAIAALRRLGAKRIVAAMPVAPADTAQELEACVEELVVAVEPFDLTSVGACYDDFRQVSDAEVVRLLDEAGERGRRWSSAP